MIRSFFRNINATGVLTLLAVLSCTLYAGDGVDSNAQPTNLQIIQKHFGDMAEQILRSASLTPEKVIGLKIRYSPESWVADHAFAGRFDSCGYKVKYAGDSAETAPVIFKVGEAGASVKYSNAHRFTLFGRRCAERSVTVRVQAQIYDTETGIILSGESLIAEHRDTIYVDDIPMFENPEIPMTKADLPDESFIDRFIEPIIIVGTAGVAVFLFFHIRS